MLQEPDVALQDVALPISFPGRVTSESFQQPNACNLLRAVSGVLRERSQLWWMLMASGW
jgi:hypothetical protein